jgi:hypothetical protein
MAKFRADYEVRASLVLPPGAQPLTIDDQLNRCEISFQNAPADSSGHTPCLIVRVIGESDAIDDVADKFQSLLADRLDVVSFATHSRFVIHQCLRVLDWEPHQKRRRVRPAQKFNPLYPPNPDFQPELMQTIQAIVQASLESYQLRALHYFREGVIENDLPDQFLRFWAAIETIAEARKRDQ